ncbi:restriction endonuclease subunit S [Bacillus cereus group sp. Bce037]|uniref:restriction endonuclease subunit S n=1 Tax=Bacillus cereus group sp. Bce037 TaxID=3445232 RepID=UPI003F213BF4
MKKNNMPWVRFAGFIEEWGQCKLGEISEKVTEKNKDNIYSETLTNSAELGIINQRDFFDKDISNKKNLDGYYVVHPDDFVYNPKISNLAPVGPIKRNKLGRTGVMSPLYYVFRTHDVDKTYLEKYFSSNSWHLFMKLNGDSGARADRFAIKDSIFREMPIPIPLIEEQTKIGNFFKQLDNTIALHQQELTTLKQTKQGFLQKMFPKEGESVPEIRFPGFTGDWEQRKFGEIFDVHTDFVSNGSFQALKDNVKLYTQENYAYMIRLQDASNNWKGPWLYTDKKGFDFLKKSTVYENDILMSDRGTIGKFFQVPKLNKPMTLSSNAVLLRSSKNDNSFIYYMLNTENIKNQIVIRTTPGVQPMISKTEFKKILSSLPLIDEQQKIGSFFKQLDDTISLHQRELDALKETKKAFLQKMFI